MQTLKVAVSLPDATHPDMELRLSADDATCDVIITLPTQSGRVAHVAQAPRDAEAAGSERDDYALGGYAGI
ncbi:hypothetical protein [Dyella subtropica]|uniref:hypothetical protein n=1 Tax=Dyella subtropica TaxID=2992127 RepID=UPI002251B1A5|nr:hypothetical protein [Dyella subtropica]